MQFVDSILPWTKAPVRQSGNLIPYLAEQLPAGSVRYLPASITLFADPEIGEAAVSSFLQGMGEHLRIELERRSARRKRFVGLGLLTEDELETFLTARTDIQPWAIYFSKDGGLGGPAANNNAGGDLQGVIPCSSMQNHGVAWERDENNGVRSWLATSRREGQDWDWESDIGHESAHAAFAQVPLFVQSFPQIADDVLSQVTSHGALNSIHITQMIYLYSEIAVVAVRGEIRPTATGLPVARPAELSALLRLSADLANNVGFERATEACARTQGRIDVNQDDEIFEIAAPIMRLIPHLARFVNTPEPPSPEIFREVLATVPQLTAPGGACSA
ncbi:MAG: hypothetical protein WA655_25205 [Candidatus Korobacteraceae bacterium]